MRKLIVTSLALFLLLAGASANAGVIRLAAKGAKHAPHVAGKILKKSAHIAKKVAI